MGQDPGDPFVVMHSTGSSPSKRPLTEQRASPPRAHGVARSAFGVQSLSHKPSSLPQSFGAHPDREQAGKVFISAQHLAVDGKGRLGASGNYQLPSALFKQVDANKRTAPAYSFSAMDRHPSPHRPNSVPGPGAYNSVASVGVQHQSNKESQPHAVFGTSSRDQASKQFVNKNMLTGQMGTGGADTMYVLTSSLGTQPMSLRRSSPAFSLAQTDRLKESYEKLCAALPAPGKYEAWEALGKQPQSGKLSSPAWGFKGSAWSQEQARFVSSQHTEAKKGTASPGNFNHQTDQALTSFGRQTLSYRNSPPRATFGSESKNSQVKTLNTPGPGHYDY